ncbi:MAG: hypothetical protein V4484_22135 [Pseudomonadota bacterium]
MTDSKRGLPEIATVAGNGTTDNTAETSELGMGGAATAAPLNSPKGIAFDSKGALYIAAGTYIRKVTPAGIIHNFAGTPSCLSANRGDGGPATP